MPGDATGSFHLGARDTCEFRLRMVAAQRLHERGTERVTLATNKGLPLLLNLRITANFNKRGDLVGQFVAVTSKGKILRDNGVPVLIANFGPPV